MKYKLSKEILEEAVNKSESIASICRLLNIRPVGGNYKTIKNKLLLWNIDTSHFKGMAWNKGLTYNSKLKKPLIEILVENSDYLYTDKLRKRLIAEGLKERRCECCGLNKWNNEEIPLELNHINGVNNDNRIENLEIICPNCHAQTPTFRGRNILSAINEIKKETYERHKNIPRIKKEKKFCIVCKNETKNIYCSIECYRKQQLINNPTSVELLETFRVEKTFSGVGRKYGVSDNAVRKWCKKYNILDEIKTKKKLVRVNPNQ